MTTSEVALCARAIRAELKKAFPRIKFSVRSKSYSMGCSVNVSYTDGPTQKAVESLLGEYTFGHFDGQQDIYDITNSRDDIPQTKFLFVSRGSSEEVDDALKTALKFRFEKLNEWEIAREVWRVFENLSYPCAASLTAEKLTDTLHRY